LDIPLGGKDAVDLASENGKLPSIGFPSIRSPCSSGELIDLLAKNKTDYAKRFLEARGTYLLIKVSGINV
jgi:hypothetical protein